MLFQRLISHKYFFVVPSSLMLSPAILLGYWIVNDMFFVKKITPREIELDLQKRREQRQKSGANHELNW
jgi:hypothetical protein